MCNDRRPKNRGTDDEPLKARRKLIPVVQRAVRIALQKSQPNAFTPGQCLYMVSGKEFPIHGDRSARSLINNVSLC